VKLPVFPLRNPHSAITNPSEAGVVLITTLFLMTLLVVFAASGFTLSRTDLMIARNLLSGIQAFWLARAGAEMGKNWLEINLATTPLPVTLGATGLVNGTYTVEIAALGNGAYRLTSTGLGPEGSRRVVEEIVRLPDFTPSAAVTSEGDGLHPDFDDNSGGTGRRIPDFSIDGRNHASDGSLSTLCPAVSPFATTQVAAQSDLFAAADILKHEVVIRANSFCQADGSSTVAGVCTPGLAWVRGSGVLPRFTSGSCTAVDPSCFVNLDLSAAALHATAYPPDANLPPAPQDRGPFAPNVTLATPFARGLNLTEQTRLHTAIDTIVQRVEELPVEKIIHISASVTSGTQTYGTVTEPKVTQIEDGVEALEFSGGAVVNGTGMLIIPRVLTLRNVTLNWQGIIVIVDDGNLQVDDPAACGQIVGAVVIRDDAATDRKLDLDRVTQTGGCSPLTVKYSCETVTQALTLLMQTTSWIEKFTG
jgi:hypothetical protein